jgi:rhodanese-related sulfurtransferase
VGAADRYEPTRKVSRDEVCRLLESGGVRLVEALGPMYFADAHLPGAVGVPPDLAARLAPLLLPDHDATVVTYSSDETCSNSEILARQLREMGYTDVMRYPGGKQDWICAGLPVERDDDASPAPDERHNTNAKGR